MKTNKHITIGSEVFKSYADNIRAFKVKSIQAFRERAETKTVLKIGLDSDIYAGSIYIGEFDETVFKNLERSEIVYVSLKEAQEKQAELRALEIKRLLDIMQKATTDYNNQIIKWYNKPLSNPYKENQV